MFRNLGSFKLYYSSNGSYNQMMSVQNIHLHSGANTHSSLAEQDVLSNLRKKVVFLQKTFN